MEVKYFFRIFVITGIMFFLFILVQNERMGITLRSDIYAVEFLQPIKQNGNNVYTSVTDNRTIEETTNYLVVFNSQEDFSVTLKDNVVQVLNYMSIHNFDVLDIYEEMPVYKNYKHIIFAINDYFLLNDTMYDLLLFVAEGGTVLISASILPNGVYRGIYRHLGIRESRDFIGTSITEIEIASDGFLAGISAGEVFKDDGTVSIQDFMLNVKLEDDVEVFMRDANTKAPLAWKANYKEGYFVVYSGFNNATKANRGILAALISQLKPVSIYPIANVFVMYIDGYPAPATTQISEIIREQYHMSERDFIRNIWWRDMRNLSRNHNMPYTASLVATENVVTQPPFKPERGDEIIARSALEILALDGEIALHGYNKIPLAKNVNFSYDGSDFIIWQSQQDMEASLLFLLEYAKLLIGRDFQVYVPPNNILDNYGRSAVVNALNISVIASTYFPIDDNATYSQEFYESHDGIIEFPRIGSGYIVGSSNKLVYLSLNTLHGMHTHFVTPYEMFGDWSSQGYTWEEMLQSFENFIIDYLNRFKYIRLVTASEGALALQKYLRADIVRKFEDNTLYVEIKEFFPGQFFYLRTDKEIKNYENANISKVSYNYYLVEALGSNFKITFY